MNSQESNLRRKVSPIRFHPIHSWYREFMGSVWEKRIEHYWKFGSWMAHQKRWQVHQLCSGPWFQLWRPQNFDANQIRTVGSGRPGSKRRGKAPPAKGTRGRDRADHLRDGLRWPGSLLTYFQKTSMCTGFTMSGDSTSSCAANCYVFNPGNDVEEQRFFAKNCQAFSNSGRVCCFNCKALERYYKKRANRSAKKQDSPPLPHCNHRYTTRVQLVGKCQESKHAKRQAVQKSKKESLEKDLLEVDTDDQKDLLSVFESTKRSDLPQDMHILWEQQQQMLQTAPSSRYRWHPKYVHVYVLLSIKIWSYNQWSWGQKGSNLSYKSWGLAILTISQEHGLWLAMIALN